MAAEWESFEKLIQAGGDEQTEPDTGGHAVGRPLSGKSEVKQKRVFREVQSDSDRNSNSDSEDESRPVLPALGMNSGSSYKVDQRSSSDSSQSDEKELQTKSATSDSDSASDDEATARQTELPLGKCVSKLRHSQISILCRSV